MPVDKKDKPSIVTYADHEVITPPNPLRRHVSASPATDVDDPIARAEAALSRLSGEFSDWMDLECERLDAARNAVKAEGFTKGTGDALFRDAHDIKGEAATFGFPMVAAPADSLCRLIEHTPEIEKIPVALVEQHVDAIRAIVRENARPDVHEMAEALTRRLHEVTVEFLAHANQDRPDVLEAIFAPPLAPGERSF